MAPPRPDTTRSDTTPSDTTRRKVRRTLGIRWIVSGAAVALVTVTAVAVGGFAERNTRRALTQELKSRLVVETRNLALTSTGALLSEFPELVLQPILAQMHTDHPDLTLAVVVDHEGIIRGHPETRQLGTPFARPAGLVPETDLTGLAPGEEFLASTEMLLAFVPVVHKGGNRIGTAVVAIRRDTIDAVILAARQKQILVGTVLLACGILFTFFLVSLLLHPIGVLRAGLERIGRGDLMTPVRLDDRTELGLLAETINQMSAHLLEAQSEMVEKERLSREIELAHEIQSSLLPSENLTTGEFLIDGAHRAAAEVGGDYYDILPLPDGKVGIAIADVSGKGLAGCMVTSMLPALLRAFRLMPSPSALLIQLEDNLAASLRPGTFITMFYGILDPVTGRLTFASAGHCPLLVYRAASHQAEWHATKGIPIGAVKGGALGRTLRDETVDLAPGDVLVQYTDGINEAFEPSGENQFGFERLAATVVGAGPNGCATVIGAIREAVERWIGDGTPLDDETLLVVSREVGATAAPGAVPPTRSGEEYDTVGALAKLELARRAGRPLKLAADLDALVGIRTWLQGLPLLGQLSERGSMLLESALYEVCANIVEHGYGGDARRSVELWWLENIEDDAAAGAATSGGTEPLSAAALATGIRAGLFIIVDQGEPFTDVERPSPDFLDSAVRRRGRGLGLEIIREAMSLVCHHPETKEGNITLLRFDPARVSADKEIAGRL